MEGGRTAMSDFHENAANMVMLEPRPCPKCFEIILGKNWKDHQESYCPNRRTACADGCGVQIIAIEQDVHRETCTMNRFLSRAEAGLRSNDLMEVKRAMVDTYNERVKALARLNGRGEGPFGDSNAWPNKRVLQRVRSVEGETKTLTTRLRRLCKDRMSLVLATYSTGEANDHDGSRPWDINAPLVQPLIAVLEEASICVADEQLRRRCEQALLQTLRKCLEAAIATEDQVILAETGARAEVALLTIELESIGETIRGLLAKLEAGIHRCNLRDVKSTPPDFFEAVFAGDVGDVEMRLRHENANPSANDPHSMLPPIIIAAKAGDIPMCRLLMDHRADLNVRCEVDGLSALHWATHLRNARVMEVLLAGGANPRLKDWRGQDPLMKLVRRSFDRPAPGCEWSWEIRQDVGDPSLSGPELRGSGVQDVDTARTVAELDDACLGFCFRTPEVQGQDVDRFYISLRGAGSKHSVSGLNQGLDSSKICDKPNELWTTYLKMPLDTLHDVRTLIAAAADCTAADECGLSALHHHLRSAPCHGSIALVCLLLQSGADVNKVCSTDKRATPFLMAVTSKRADMVRLMLQESFPPADVDAATPDGNSCLALADGYASHGSPAGKEIAKMLRDAGASSWSGLEFRLGNKTTFTFDSRKPACN